MFNSESFSRLKLILQYIELLIKQFDIDLGLS